MTGEDPSVRPDQAPSPPPASPVDVVAARRRDTHKVALAIALVVTVAAFALALARIATIDSVPEPADDDHFFTTTYDPPQDRLQKVITIADGQAWAALAQDPTFSHPEVFKPGTAEFVYRAQRPVFGLLVWGASGGQAGAVPVALLVLTCLGVGALAYAATLLADQQGRVRRYAWLAAVLPGSMLVVVIMGPEPLSVALAVLGVYWWLERPRRLAWAVVALTVAVLMRDTLVLVPLAMAAWELVHNRSGLRRVLPLAIPPLGYATWVVVLRIRWGYWSNQSSSGRGRLDLPFRGWIGAIGDVGVIRTGSFVLGAILLAIAIVRHRESVLTWIAALFALSTIFYGVEVLATESHRPLLAMYVFALLVCLPVDRSHRAQEAQRARAELVGAPPRRASGSGPTLPVGA